MPFRPLRLPAAALLVSVLAACASAAPRVVPPASWDGGTIVYDTVRSAALAGNLLGDSPEREVAVYLPPGYAVEARRRYPVVYLLHGFAGDPGTWVRGFDVRGAMDSLIAAGSVRPAIVVMPNELNAYGGAFYLDSPVAGRWETFTARELVRHVDGRYRTVPRAAGRAVAGWSMGGYGALHLAARHPDVFSAAYALSPCCLGPELVDDLRLRAAAWDTTLALRERPPREALGFWTLFHLGLASVRSPNPTRPPLFVDLPFTMQGDSLVTVDSVLARWTAETPAAFVASRAGGLRRLRGLAFDAGARDGFRHIPPTARQLSAKLSAAGIPHAFEEYDGTHGSHVRERLRTRVFPLLLERLESGR